MRKYYVTLLLLLVCDFSFADFEQRAPDAIPSTYLSFDMGAGYGYSNIVNTNGTEAVYSGVPITFDLNFVATVPQTSFGLGVFVHYGYNQMKNEVENTFGRTQELKQEDTLYGGKAWIFPFYAGFGLGQTKSMIDDSGSSNKMSLSSRQLGFTAGVLALKLSDRVHLGLSAWYKTSFYDLQENASLTQSTRQETLEFFVNINIFPLFELL